jgi:CyaY protein
VDESSYQQLVARTFRGIEDALENVDPDDVELSNTGDVLTLTFKNGVRCVLNTQRPVRQLWMAARDTAWHFGWDDASAAWLDDRGRGLELRATLAKVIEQQSGRTVAL